MLWICQNQKHLKLFYDFFCPNSRTTCDRKETIMQIVHIFKDGTRTNELKNVYVPDEIVQNVAKVAERVRKAQKQKEKGGE